MSGMLVLSGRTLSHRHTGLVRYYHRSRLEWHLMKRALFLMIRVASRPMFEVHTVLQLWLVGISKLRFGFHVRKASYDCSVAFLDP